MKVVSNVEPVWNVSGQQGPPFGIDTSGATPHYFIRQVAKSLVGEEVEVHFLGDATREGTPPDCQLPSGKPVFHYESSTGHLRSLLSDKERGGCFLLKQDGTVWRLLGIRFFVGGDPAVGHLRREKAAREPPLDAAKRLLDEGSDDVAAIKVGTELERHLRVLAAHFSIPLDHKGHPKKADRLNAELGAAGCYAQLDQKSVTAWLELRNKAAHGHHDAFTAEQVGAMILGVREFVSRCSVAKLGPVMRNVEPVSGRVSKPTRDQVLERAVKDAMKHIPGSWSWPNEVFKDRNKLLAWFASATRDEHGGVLLPSPVSPTPGVNIQIPKAFLVAAKRALIEEEDARLDDPLE